LPSRNSLKSRSTEPSSPERAWQYALRLLAARDYTSARLRKKLRDRLFSDADADAAIARLEAEQWLNDRRFAERFAESALAAGRFFGPRLRVELRRRGVPTELVDEVLGHALAEYDEGEELRVILDRRFPEFDATAAGDREKRRVVGFLQRRGFGLAAIFKAIKA